MRASSDTTAHAISWDFVHAFGFGPRGQIWYGTVGNGWGVSTDGGKSWRNWQLGQLGPDWQYVARDGIATKGDTVYVGTADGVKLTFDDGATWHEITDSAQAARTKHMWGRIPNQYVLAVAIATDGSLLVRHLLGVSRSADGGRSFVTRRAPYSCRTPSGLCGRTFNAWVVDAARGQMLEPVRVPPVVLPEAVNQFPRTGDATGPVLQSAQPRHMWFRRPIAGTDQPMIDQTYRYGSTMGGNFQQHQGVEFNNANGTPVLAIGDGIVVWAAPAERGALTVAIRHERKIATDSGPRFLFSVYYHNSKLYVTVGKRVRTGDPIAEVGNTGRATNDHLHLEVHAVPVDSVQLVVDPEQRFPRYTTNPELWIDPLRGTGMVAGQVWDSAGRPLQQARIYGLVKPEPEETPFSFVETYGDRAHGSPVYREHFAISDVPAGDYTLGVAIDGRRVVRRIRVDAGRLTWVEFRPD
jgi:murein DD-endopeptidase MepM/ murein hydrolase activator NlpD